MKNLFNKLMLVSYSVIWISCQSHTVFNVSEFGAFPNDGLDDTEAVMAAIEKASSVKDATLVFETGQYDFINPAAMQVYESMINAAHPGKERWMGPPPLGFEGWPADKNTVLKLKGISNLAIDGQGSEFMFYGLCQAIYMEDCRHVTIKNIHINYQHLPFMAGKIVNIGETWIDVAVENKKIAGGEPVIAFQMYEPDTHRPTSVETFAGVQSTENIGENVLRLHMTSDDRGHDMPAKVKSGYYLVMRHLLGGYEPVEIKEGKDILLEHIDLYTGAGMGILGVGTENLTLSYVNIIPKENNLMSTTADGTHFIGCRGMVRLDNCRLIGEGDDHFNLHGQSVFVDEIIDRKTIKASIGAKSGFGMWSDWWVNGWTSWPRTGETVEFCQQDDLNILGRSVISSVQPDKETGYLLIFFEDHIPETIEPGFIFQVTEQVPVVRISDCYFGMNRSRGLLLTSRDIIVENNTFEYTGGTPIFVCAEVDWKAIPAPADVRIRQNIIRDCNYAVGNERAAITMLFKQNAQIEGYMENVSVCDNRISGQYEAGILAQQIRHLEISGNMIEGLHPAIVLQRCEEVILRNNPNVLDADIQVDSLSVKVVKE